MEELDFATDVVRNTPFNHIVENVASKNESDVIMEFNAGTDITAIGSSSRYNLKNLKTK